ncbi:helix-turn-helix domain-containing protein [Tannockella kyphosi]|uniref:helix-turn-helix domain-containing protein n=1 Tax=Tannockella kyphosi TaxID=2899121 RepID=UPI0037DA1C09
MLEGDLNDVWRKIKKLRTNRNNSLTDAANVLSIGISTLSEYENDVTCPTLPRFFSLIEFYHVTENYFYPQGEEIINISNFSIPHKKKIYAIIAAEISENTMNRK